MVAVCGAFFTVLILPCALLPVGTLCNIDFLLDSTKLEACPWDIDDDLLLLKTRLKNEDDLLSTDPSSDKRIFHESLINFISLLVKFKTILYLIPSITLDESDCALEV